MGVQLHSALTAEQRTFYDDLLLDRALPALVHAKYAVKRPIPANEGNVINVRRFELISSAPTSITALTEGTAGAQSTPSISAVAATISQYGRWFQITEYLADVAIDQVITEYTTALGDQAGIDIDIVVRDVLAAGSTVQYASTSASRGNVGSGMLLTSAEIREIVRTMRGANAKPVADNKYIAIVHPNTMADLLADTDAKLTFQHSAGDNQKGPMYSGVVGDYLGLRFVETANAKVQASYGLSGADVYQTIILADQAYMVSDLSNQTLRTYFQPRGSAGTADPLSQLSTLGYKAAFACTILNNNFMLRLEHVTTAKQAA